MLVPCRNCGHQISDKAEECPKCGASALPPKSERVPLFTDFPRGVPGRDPAENTMPSAQWADEESVLESVCGDPRDPQNLAHSGAKFFVGAIEGKLVGIGDDRHIVTVAGSRAGKGVSVIAPNLMLWEGSAFVLDPKGENASLTAEFRAKQLKQEVVVLDPFKICDDWVAPYRRSFNPMAILESASPTLIEDAGLIADALIVSTNAKDPHWDEMARAVLEAIILHVATSPFYHDEPNLVTVRRLLMVGAPRRSAESALQGFPALLVEMASNPEANGIISATAEMLMDIPEKELSSILTTARRHTKFLDFPAVQSVLLAHEFDLSGLKSASKGMTVYLCLPASRLPTCARWFRLCINLALEAMERTRLPNSSIAATSTGNPVLFCLDEMAALGHMAQLENAAGYIAGFGAKLWSIIQDVGQLEALYEKRWQTFLGNSGTWQFFGNTDIATLEFVSKRLGDTSVQIESRSQTTHSGRMSGGLGSSWSHQVVPLLTPEEASRLFGRDDPKRRQLIIRAGKDPIVLPRTLYFDARLPEHFHFSSKYRPVG